MVARSSRSPVNPRERVEKLSHLLRERFPDIELEVDAPSKVRAPADRDHRFQRIVITLQLMRMSARRTT